MSKSRWDDTNRLVLRILAGLISPEDPDPTSIGRVPRLNRLIAMIQAARESSGFDFGADEQTAKHALRTWLRNRRGKSKILYGKFHGFLKFCFQEDRLHRVARGNVAPQLRKLLKTNEVRQCIRGTCTSEQQADKKITDWLDALHRISSTSTTNVPRIAIPPPTAGESASIESRHGSIHSYEELLRAYLESLQRRLSHPHRFMLPHHQNWYDKPLYRARVFMLPQLPRREPSAAQASAQSPLSQGVPSSFPTVIQRQQQQLLNDLLQPMCDKRFCIAGHPGLGKSTLLESLAWRLVKRYLADPHQQPRRVPILIDLTDWSKAGSLDMFIAHSAARQGLADTGLLTELYRRGEVVLLLDCLDGVRETGVREHLARELDSRLEQSPLHECPVVLTSRPWAIQEIDLRGFRSHQLELKPFSLRDTTEFIRCYCAGDSRWANRLIRQLRSAPAQTSRLVRTPLMLSLLCFTSRTSRALLPVTKGELLERSLRELLRRREPQLANEGGLPHGLSSVAALQLLSRLAWECWAEAPDLGLSEDQGLEAVAQATKDGGPLRAELGGSRPGAILKSLARHSGVLAEAGPGTYRFSERTCLEYLAGRWLARESVDTMKQEFAAHTWDPEWDGVLRFMTGTLWRGRRDQRERANRLVSWILAECEAGHDDSFGTLAFTAARLLGEAGELRNEPERALAHRVARHALRAWLRDMRMFKAWSFSDRTAERGYQPQAIVQHVLGDIGPALAVMGDRHIFGVIRRMLHNALFEQEARLAAAALCAIDAERAIDLICNVLISDSCSSRGNSFGRSVRITGSAGLRTNAREGLIRFLGEFPSERAERALTYLLGSSKEPIVIRNQAAESLFRIRGRSVLSAIADYTLEPCSALGESIEKADMLGELLESLPAQPVLDRLIGLVVDPSQSSETRAAAARALVRADSRAGYSAIVDCLTKPPITCEWSVRESFVVSLRHARSRRLVIPAVIDALHNPREHLMTRESAVMTLGHLKADQAVDLLAVLLKRPEEVIGDYDKHHSPEELRMVEGALRYRDQSRSVLSVFRGDAAHALGEIGSDLAIQALIEVIDQVDDDPDVQAAVARSLGLTRAAHALARLIRILQDPSASQTLREAAVVGLDRAELPIDDAIDLLGRICLDADNDWPARCAAARVLGRSRSEQAISVLEEVLHMAGSDIYPPMVRGAAELALEEISTDRALAAPSHMPSERVFRILLARGFSRGESHWSNRRDLRLH
jgi:HEAT repeat protein